MTGKEVGQFREHEKRCWSVDFNSLDPEILASGSDDSKVRIWSMKCQKAVSTIGIKGLPGFKFEIRTLFFQPMYAAFNSIPIPPFTSLLARPITASTTMTFADPIASCKFSRFVNI